MLFNLSVKDKCPASKRKEGLSKVMERQGERKGAFFLFSENKAMAPNSKGKGQK